MNFSRKWLRGLHVVFLSLAALAWSQVPKTSTAKGDVGVVTDRTSAHTQQGTFAPNHMPFVWDHRFAHFVPSSSVAAQESGHVDATNCSSPGYQTAAVVDLGNG